jgi:hypothetical protein
MPRSSRASKQEASMPNSKPAARNGLTTSDPSYGPFIPLQPSLPGRLHSSWSMGRRLFFPPTSSLGHQECSPLMSCVKRTSSRVATSSLKKLGDKQRFMLQDTSRDYTAIIAATFKQGLWRSAIWCLGGYSLARASTSCLQCGRGPSR